MKKINLFSLFSGLLSLLAISACDKFEEDTTPLLASKLVVKNDSYTTIVNQKVELKVLTNDSVSGFTSVEFEDPKYGRLQLTGTPGHAFYQPDHDYLGRDTVRYLVCVGGNCIAANAFIIVQPDLTGNPCNVAINNDEETVYQNQNSYINILQNDTTCNFQPDLVQAPANGQASLNSFNELVYRPNPGFTGTDEVQYSLGSLIAKVRLKVEPAPANCTLKAFPDVTNLTHNQPFDTVHVNVLANDTWCPAPPSVSVNLVSQSSFGSVQVVNLSSGPKILYSTNTSLRNVTDTFRYRICQGNSCSISTVTVNIK